MAKDEGGQISRVRAFGAWILVSILRAMVSIKGFKAELHLAGATGGMCILKTHPRHSVEKGLEGGVSGREVSQEEARPGMRGCGPGRWP